jgi:chromosome segregation ATPase
MAPAIIPAENPALPGQMLEKPIRDILDVAAHLKFLRTPRARTGPSEIDNAIRIISGAQATIQELEDWYVTLCDEQRKHRDLQETAATSLKRIVEERLGEIGDLDGKHTELESDIQNLRVEKARLDADVQSLTKSKERLVQSVKELELEKVTKQGKFESLKGEVEKKANELRDLTSKVGDLGTSLERSERQVEAKDKALTSLRKQMADQDTDQNQRITQLMDDVKSVTMKTIEEIHKLERERDEALQKVTNLQLEICAQKTNNTENIKRLEGERDKALRQVANLGEQRAARETRYNSGIQKAENERDEALRLQMRAEDAKKELENLILEKALEISTANTTIQNLQDEVSDLTQHKEEWEKMRQCLLNFQMGQDIVLLVETEADLLRRIENCEKENARFEREAGVNNEEMARLRVTQEELESRVSGMDHDIVLLRDEEADLLRRIEHFEVHISRLEREAVQNNEEIARLRGLEEHLAAARTKMDEHLLKLQGRIDTLSDLRERYHRRIEAANLILGRRFFERWWAITQYALVERTASEST